jgi:hypothetical protein
MARPAGGGHLTCESCQSIDVREWGSPGTSAPQPTVLMVLVTWRRAFRQHRRADRVRNRALRGGPELSVAWLKWQPVGIS